RTMIEAADAIICISENTKADLQERYAIPDARITVTPLASDLGREMSFGPETVPKPPFVLFIGNRGIYKNFIRTVLGFSRVVELWPELTLCIVGEALHDHELELVQALGLTLRISQVGFVDDAHLAKLYRCSEALIYPSLYEGFGIPPLDAMACGTVVISSDRSSLPEVVGNAAIIVNPESVDELADAILSLRELGGKREALIDRGIKHASHFTWEETTRRTVEVYKSVAA
ncbi:MAG: glycosyltransferase family 4 protein, partial [Bryobacteraceae bacterium]